MMMPSPAGDPVPPVAPPPPIGQPLAALGLRAELLDCRIGAIAFSGNGKWLAAADGGRVHFFDAQGNHARELRLEPDRLAGSQWLPFQVRGICRALHARGPECSRRRQRRDRVAVRRARTGPDDATPSETSLLHRRDS